MTTPYRAPPPSAARLGWTYAEAGPRTTLFVRDHGSQTLVVLGAATIPIAWLARALARTLAGASPWTWAVVAAFVLGTIALWPRARETLRIGPDGIVWRDRILASKARVALARAKLETMELPNGRALMLADGRARFLVARGEAADVDELARRIERAIADARSSP